MTVHKGLSGPSGKVVGEPVRRWRLGGKVPFTVYEQRGDEPDTRPYPDGDRPVTMFRTAEDAALAVRAVNALIGQGEADG